MWLASSTQTAKSLSVMNTPSVSVRRPSASPDSTPQFVDAAHGIKQATAIPSPVRSEMATDIQQGVFYDTPVQGGEEKVTRQAGLPRSATIGIDPTPPPPIIQGDPLTVATRNAGPHVAEQFASDGTFHSDRRADDNTLYVDHALSDPEALPPGIARAALTPTDVPTPGRVTGFGDMTAVQQRAAIKAQAEALGFVVTHAPVEAKDSPTAFNVIASDEGAHDPPQTGQQR